MNNKTLGQVIKFTLFSSSAGIIQILTFTILNELITIFSGDYGINYFIALLLSILWNFTFNRKYTFKSDGNINKAMLLVLLFYLFFTPLSILLGNSLIKFNLNEYLVLFMTMILNFVLEFLYTKYVVYKKKAHKIY